MKIEDSAFRAWQVAEWREARRAARGRRPIADQFMLGQLAALAYVSLDTSRSGPWQAGWHDTEIHFQIQKAAFPL